MWAHSLLLLNDGLYLIDKQVRVAARIMGARELSDASWKTTIMQLLNEPN